MKTSGFVNKSSAESAKLINSALADNGLSRTDILELIKLLLEYILSRRWLTVKTNVISLLCRLCLFIGFCCLFFCLVENRIRSPPEVPYNMKYTIYRSYFPNNRCMSDKRHISLSCMTRKRFSSCNEWL